MYSMTRIGIIGLGYVGLAHAVAFALHGYEVVGVEINERRLMAIEQGRVNGLPQEVVRRALESRLRITNDYEKLRDVDLAFLAVGTPTNPDSSQDLSQIMSALDELARVWRSAEGNRVVVVKSTVLPGTTRRLSKWARELGLREVGFVHSPEFLVADRALEGVLRPSRVVVGGVDEKSASIVAAFFREFYRRVGFMPPIHVVSAEEAELIKYASNIFLALKTVFGNLIGIVCEELENCDAWRVIEIVGLDPRIGKSHLMPGMPYGGPCLVKDVSAFGRFAQELANIDFFISIHRYNEWLRDRIISILRERLGKLREKHIAVLGMAYKPGVSEIKDSQGFILARELLKEGAEVWIHDVEADAVRDAFTFLDGVKEIKSLEEICSMDAAIVTLNYDVYRKISCTNEYPLIVDVVNVTSNASPKTINLYKSMKK